MTWFGALNNKFTRKRILIYIWMCHQLHGIFVEFPFCTIYDGWIFWHLFSNSSQVWNINRKKRRAVIHSWKDWRCGKTAIWLDVEYFSMEKIVDNEDLFQIFGKTFKSSIIPQLIKWAGWKWDAANKLMFSRLVLQL